MAVALVAGLALAGGCGEVKPGAGAQVDAAREMDAAGGSPDALPARCDPASSFGEPVLLDVVNSTTTANDEAASLSADELTIYFSSDRAGPPPNSDAYDLYIAKRDRPDGPFPEPEIIPFADPNLRRRRPVVAAGGLDLYAVYEFGAGAFGLMVASRMNTGQNFGEFELAPGLNGDDSSDRDAYPLLGGTSIYFASDRGMAPGDFNIWRATWNDAAWADPRMVRGEGDSLVSPQQEIAPVVTPDELTLYFGSNRDDLMTHDIFVATRASVDDDFGPPMRLPSLSNTDIDAPSWVSADGCVLHLTQSVGGVYKLFVATRSP
jgi:hypothetical protein